MRALLLVFCLLWAGVQSAAHGVLALSTHRAPELTRRCEVALLSSACAPSLRVVEVRDPPLAPTPELPPFWASFPGRGDVPSLALQSHLLASAIEATHVVRDLVSARSSRGPPRLGV